MNKKTFLLLRSHTVETVLFNIVACYYQIRLLLYVFVPFIINLLEQNFQKVITLQHSTEILALHYFLDFFPLITSYFLCKIHSSLRYVISSLILLFFI